MTRRSRLTLPVLASRHARLVIVLVMVAASLVAGSVYVVRAHVHVDSDVYTCPMHPDVTQAEPGRCPKCGMDLVKITAAKPTTTTGTPTSKAAERPVYTCPMHPDVTQAEPGRCPKCGMDLVKTRSAKPTTTTGTPTSKAAERPVYTCPMHPDVTQAEPGRCPKCGMDLVKARSAKPTTTTGTPTSKDVERPVYVCPMHPDVTQTEPGRCPKCGMDLVKAGPTSSHQETSQRTGVQIDGDTGAFARAGGRTTTATFGTLVSHVRAVGSVVTDESRVRQVTTKVGGFVEHLHINTVGRYVRAGEPLLDIYSPELLASQEEFVRASRTASQFEASALPEVRTGGQELAAAARRRLELFDVPAAVLDRLVRSGVVKRTVTFPAPYSGYVTEKAVVEGQRIESGMPLMTLTDLASVWVEAQLYEHEAAQARPGQRARLTPQFGSHGAMVGRIQLVYPIVDVSSRTVRVRFEVPNPRLALKPGMFVDVELESSQTSGVVVPDSAVVDTGTRRVVFVVSPVGTFETREVAVGPRGGGQVLVVRGLQVGERVAVAANFLLDSESRLRGALAVSEPGSSSR